MMNEHERIQNELFILKVDIEDAEKRVRRLEKEITNQNIQLKNLEIIKNDYKILHKNSLKIITKLGCLFTILSSYLFISNFFDNFLVLNIPIICCNGVAVIWTILNYKYHVKIYEVKLFYNEKIVETQNTM
jgi:hypothetical protein